MKVSLRAVIAVALAILLASAANTACTPVPKGPLVVRVSGKHLVGLLGKPVQLVGVSRSGTQYMCVDGGAIFDGPSNNESIHAIRSWKVNTIRVSLNEACWLGIQGVPAAYSGSNYQNAIADYVTRATKLGVYVILDLHWNAPGNQPANDQQPMADRDHTRAFWASVAAKFKTNRGVLFELYNEPYPDGNQNTTAAWSCVKNGGTCPGVPFQAAGSQELVTAIRAAGAKNVILVGGPQYAGVVDRWTEFKPTDPANQLAASIHIYYGTPADPEFSPCYLRSCWESTIRPLSASTPVVISELGEFDCNHGLIDPLLDWADAHKVSYLAWGWVKDGCASGPGLITNYYGSPTDFGAGFRNHLLTRR